MGKKNITMAEVAKLAGVSESTVSRALAGSPRISKETTEKIRDIVRTHGYRINAKARALRTSKTQTIEVVIVMAENSRQSFSDPFFSQLISHIADALVIHNYDLLLSTVPPWSQSFGADAVAAGRADGVIIIGQGENPKLLEVCAQNNYPMVVWGAQLPDQSYCSVGSDNYNGGRIVGKHFADLERTRVAFLGDIHHVEIGLRYKGCVDILNERNIKAENIMSLAMPFDASSAYNATVQLVKNGVCWHNAIFAASDTIAIATMQALQDNGVRVPEDVAVIGYDNIYLANYTSPALSSINQSTKNGGQLLVKKLIEILKGNQPQSETLNTELVVRKSCGGSQ